MAAWMLPNEGPLTDTQRLQALANFSAYITRHAIKIPDVARKMGKPRASTIRELVKGTYREHADEHIRKLNNWVEQHARQQAVKLEGGFVDTGVAKQILAVARLVRENQTMGLVVGPTGIGKSRCAQALYETYVGSIFLTVMFGYYHPKGLTMTLAEKLGVRQRKTIQSEHANLTQVERVVAVLRDSNRLLIIDEAQKLQTGAIELLREIHDAAGVPVLLLATKELHDRIQRNADPDRGQVYSRFDITHHLTQGRDVHAGGKQLFTVAEIRALYNEAPIRLSGDAAKYLTDVANQLGYGSLRRCRILLTNAARRARKRSNLGDEDTVTVTADDLEFAETRLRQEASEVEIIKARRATAASA